MAKQGIYFGNITPVLQRVATTTGWALCVGAGTSQPLFPSWTELVSRLVTRDVGSEKSSELSKSLSKSFQPDAIIQAAKDRLKLTDTEFANILMDELYRNIKGRLDEDEWTLFSRMTMANSGDFLITDWRKYLRIVEQKLPKTSAMQIAKIISAVINTELVPTAIMSFNAETFLPSLINAYWRSNTQKELTTSKSRKRGALKKLDLITQSISHRKAGRIPYFFCHGMLPPPQMRRNSRLAGYVDKLVFSEADYLQLANSVFSWQAATFTDICSSRSVVFVGVSLSDPNMRRWLTWVHSNRKKELNTIPSFAGESAIHYWVTKRPDSHHERRWQESIVAHLGTRIIWVKNWGQIGEAINQMLGQ